MHEYRDSRIAGLMLQVNSKTSDIDLFVATTMLQMAGIEFGGVGRSLVLGVGQSTFACALGGKLMGHRVVGICFHASHVHRQNWWRNTLRSRATFTFSTPKDLLLAMPVFTWNFVFVLPYVNWDEVSDFVTSRMENSQIVVARRMPADVGDYEHVYFRTTDRGYCHETEDIESAEFVVFRAR